ncbi:MAG: hypothetical protein KY469_02770 [Actinobacteria bacterium]|nr:hypothetical protein [Actinomycetota bacterium]
MRRKFALLLSIGLVAALVPALSALPALSDDCSEHAPPPLEFDRRRYIDTTRAGGEPVSVVAPDGSISVSAHAGTTHIYKDPAALPGYYDFLGSYYNQTLNWRSTDGGETWQYVGTAGLPVGPHSPTSTGFSDPDFDIDLGGRIYNTEIDLANVAVFSSDDYGQSYNLAEAFVTAGDRPWVTGGNPEEVFLYVNLPKQLWRSENGGITWDMVKTGFPGTSKLIRDPLQVDWENLDAPGFIAPAGQSGITITPDDGETWVTHPNIEDGKRLESGTQFFGAIAIDNGGTVYQSSAGGYRGSSDTNPNGFVEFAYFERDPEVVTNGTWGEKVMLDIPEGDAMWPWIIAGDDGRVAVTWYQTLVDPETGEHDPTKFYLFVAYSLNAHGSEDGCPPQFAITNASKDPIHVGNICLSGTTCNANQSFEAGDRRLGDFFTVNFDHEGTIFVVSGDTTVANPVGGPKPVGNPIFIKATEGGKLLEQPRELEPTRCLYNIDALCGGSD